MSRYKQVQGEAGDDVGPSVAVAAEADEDAILLSLVGLCVGAGWYGTFLKFTIISRKLDTTGWISLAHADGSEDAYSAPES